MHTVHPVHERSLTFAVAVATVVVATVVVDDEAERHSAEGPPSAGRLLRPEQRSIESTTSRIVSTANTIRRGGGFVLGCPTIRWPFRTTQ